MKYNNNIFSTSVIYPPYCYTLFSIQKFVAAGPRLHWLDKKIQASQFIDYSFTLKKKQFNKRYFQLNFHFVAFNFVIVFYNASVLCLWQRYKSLCITGSVFPIKSMLFVCMCVCKQKQIHTYTKIIILQNITLGMMFFLIYVRRDFLILEQ